MQPTDDTTFTHYDRLGVSQEAGPEEIRGAYHSLVRKYYPGAGPPAARQHLREVTRDLRAARDVLLDQQARANYDRTLELERDLRELDVSGLDVNNPDAADAADADGATGVSGTFERECPTRPSRDACQRSDRDSGPEDSFESSNQADRQAGDRQPDTMRPGKQYSAVLAGIIARTTPVLVPVLVPALITVAVGWAWWMAFVAAVVVSGGVPFAVSLSFVLMVAAVPLLALLGDWWTRRSRHAPTTTRPGYKPGYRISRVLWTGPVVVVAGTWGFGYAYRVWGEPRPLGFLMDWSIPGLTLFTAAVFVAWLLESSYNYWHKSG